MTLSVTEEGGRMVAKFPVEIDMGNAAAIQHGLRQALSGRPRVLVLDLTETRFFGADGVQTISYAHRLASARAVRLVVAIPDGGLTSRVFALTGLYDLVATTTNADAADLPPR